ncbi:unnamed protein product [Phaedon cochleariae]|uniref:C2H2-type domain-containing protein n=1 Tax=Phaedon cochleariae TaxID=80249 RepID=A0A9N9SEM8_PHACE|nr:unnamed protein product [Phaedon cochleariae]
MTSVTLPSSSGTLNGGYSSPVTGEISNSKADFDTPRSNKRSLSITSSESCKKRRKQSTPIRISTTESESSSCNSQEGKPSPVEPNFPCPICQVSFPQQELLQNHMICDHPVDCKKEPEEQHHVAQNSVSFVEQTDASMGLSMMRTDMPWVDEMQGKEWMSSNLANMPFNPANPLFMTLPQFSQPENIPIKPIRIFNPDAYCDLCNKEFCNKYFLKTHKANKHGIYMDNSSSESFQTSVTFPSVTSNIKLTNPVPSVESSTIKNEAIASVTNPFHTLFSNPFSNQANLSEGELNENVAISNGRSSSSESDKIFPDDQPARENRSPSITQTESTSVKNEPDIMFQDTSSKLPSDQASRELDLSYRLRKIGVMNPKAFCEICCKEYCNKYFLRTHKLKRHGIYIPDEREKSENCTINFSSSTNVQTSPLNLIMTEQTSSDSKTTSPSNITCDICCIKFQNASLAHIHSVTVHGKVFTKETEETTAQEPRKLPEMFKTTDKSLNAEAISEDLQKLQTMILQLNELDPSRVALACTMCNKEFDNRFYLHAHMMSEHGILIDEPEVEKSSDTENISNNNTMCDICGKEVQNADEMSKHIQKFHTNNQPMNETSRDDYTGYNSGEKLPNRISVSSGVMPERRISMNVTPTSSYCEICNKELCNKYFMKTHMQRMHGIEIENGAQIGGVVCDICNKELCSKYFLRVHKHNTHGIIEYGTNLLPPRKSEGEITTLTPTSAPLETDPALKPGDLADLSHRYFTHFTEVCTICSRRFRSTKWLKAHLVTDHGQAGTEKWAEIEHQLQQNRGAKPATSISVEGTSPNLKIPNGGHDQQQKTGIQNFISSLFGIDESNSKMYQCSFCPFTSPLLPLLFVHERSHSLNLEGIPMKCPVCPQSFTERELLQRHILAQHPFLLPSTIKEEDTDQKEVKESGEEAESYSDMTKPEQTMSPTTRQQDLIKNQRQTTSPIILKPVELSSEMGKSLNDAAKKMQWPATYAIPQNSDQDPEDVGFSSRPGYVMQAFLLEESTSERRVLPSVVFLPMLQKQPAPISVTFTLTPA